MKYFGQVYNQVQEYGNYEISVAIVQDLGGIGWGTNTYLLNIELAPTVLLYPTLYVCVFLLTDGTGLRSLLNRGRTVLSRRRLPISNSWRPRMMNKCITIRINSACPAFCLLCF